MPSIDGLTLQDIQSEDFFRRFDDPKPVGLPEDAGMLPHTSKPSDIAHNEDDGQATKTPQDANLARRLMMINQDMASFGAQEGIDAKLQDRMMADPIAFYA